VNIVGQGGAEEGPHLVPEGELFGGKAEIHGAHSWLFVALAKAGAQESR
jgi:hypothetical protein